MLKIFLGLIAIFSGYLLFGENGLLGLAFMGLGTWLIWSGIKKMKNESASTDEWLSLIANTQYQYTNKSDYSGIAIDTKERVLHLRHPNLFKSYPFSEIRSWRYNLSTGGHIRTYGNVGLQAGMQAVGENIRVERENKKASGFFVTVRDIDNPEWRTGMSSEKEMKRWMEIFAQFVGEQQSS